MKFENDDISDKMRQAALFALAPEAVVENELAGRRALDNYAKARCMIDDMIGDKREARGAINIEWRRQSTAARPVEAPRNDVGLRGRSERRRERHKLRPKARRVFECNCRNAHLCFEGQEHRKRLRGSMGPRFLHWRPVAGHIAECGPAVESA